MAKIIDLINYYKQEVLKQSIKGTIVSSSDYSKSDNKLNKEDYLYFEEQTPDHIKFSKKGKLYTIRTKEDYDIQESNISTDFCNLYMVSNIADDDIIIERLRCAKGKTLPAEQHICISNEYVRKLSANVDPHEECRKLKRNLVFWDGRYEYLIIETFPSNTGNQSNITLHGLSMQASVSIIDGKWVITKQTKKNLSRKHSKFLEYQIQRYSSVNVTEETEAKAALTALDEDEKHGGSTLLSLWQKYSAIERRDKEALRDQLSSMNFTLLEYLPNGRTRVKLNVSSDVWRTFIQHKDDLIGERLELVTKKNVPVEYPDDELMEQTPFIIRSINEKRELEVSDECYLIKKDGIFVLSTVGDETMDDRRNYALETIRNHANQVLRALRLSIEDQADKILVRKQHEPYDAITERTDAFLRKEFGISSKDLTQDQRDAIKMALNTPDIALIQGPPGTGKTTVVATICDRLEEEAEKDPNFDDRRKLFLISAYQNDTVEHIASKIKTHGLPTPKINKETGDARKEGSLPAEKKFINEMKATLAQKSEELITANRRRVSVELTNMLSLLKEGKSINRIKSYVDDIIRTYDIPEELSREWKQNVSDGVIEDRNNEKLQEALEGLPNNLDEFKSFGKSALARAIQKVEFTKEEKDSLRKIAISKDITEADMEAMAVIRDKYLNELKTKPKSVHDDSFIEPWLNKAIEFFVEKEETSYEDPDTFYAAIIDSIQKDLKGNDEHILSSLKAYSSSIAATNQVAGGKAVSDVGNVHNVILEEAARSNPLDLLIPMTKAEDRIIMVGDHQQLPHMLEPKIADEAVSGIKDDELRAQLRKGYEDSLFKRIFDNLQKDGVVPQRQIMLRKQFRMHPVIGDFVSQVYYQGKLESGNTEITPHGLSFDLVKDKVAVFDDIPTSQGQEEQERSKYRLSECARVLEILDLIFKDPESKDLSVGVITFYAKQRDTILEMASQDGRVYTEDAGEGIYRISEEFRNFEDGKERLRIGSVDSFQGKEFDVVILSTVRSNDIKPSDPISIQNEIKRVKERKKIDITEEEAKENLLRQKYGFLMLENRLNVAFSRAKKLLITIGDGAMYQDEDAQTYVEGLYEFYKRFANK